MGQETDLPQWLDSTTAADAAGAAWALPSWVCTLDPSRRFVGRAVTALGCRDDNGVLAEAMRAERSGDVLVVAGAGESRTAVIGDLMARELYLSGFRALVTDGPVRDGPDIATLPLQVWSRGTTTPASRKDHKGHLGIPVSIAGVTICPGDLVVADAGGVVIWPQASLESLLEAATSKHLADAERLERIEAALRRAEASA